MRALLKTLTVSVLVLFLGLHWAILQTVAWTGMLISYSRGVSMKVAVAKTFDGQHPCPLCKAIKKGRAEEKQREQQQSKPVSKLDFGMISQAVTLTFERDNVPIPAFNSSAPSRTDAPPKPRPRDILQGSHAHV